MRDLATNDDVSTELCVAVPGIAHDFRPRTYQRWGKPHTSWVCVWCNGVACGDYDEADPCWLVYHHQTPHRSRSGIVWPLGSSHSGGSV
jgi:hypothetical protein